MQQKHWKQLQKALKIPIKTTKNSDCDPIKKGRVLGKGNMGENKRPKNKHENHLTDALKSRSHLLIFFLVMFILASSLYLRVLWNNYYEETSMAAITLAESVEALLHSDHIAALSGNESDLEKTEYIMATLSLSNLTKTSDSIHFAYILGEKNGHMVFMADSEPPDSPDYSPPGQIYVEATATDWEPFRTVQTVLTEPTTDRWGTWVSAMVPIIDPVDGNVIAVLGIDYSAKEWQAKIWEKMIPDIIILFSALLLLIAFIGIWIQRSYLRTLEGLYHNVFNQAPIGIAVLNDKGNFMSSEIEYTSSNQMYEDILGRTKEELMNISWAEITHPEDLPRDLENARRFLSGETSGYSMEKRFIRPDDSIVWTNMKISRLEGVSSISDMHLCLLEDITLQKETEKSLLENQRREALIMAHLPGMAYRAKYNSAGTMLIVSEGCFKLTGYEPESFIEGRVLEYNDIMAPEGRDLLHKEWERTIPYKLPYKCEYGITTASGEKKWVLEMGEGIYNDEGQVLALEGMIFDVTERQEAAKQNEFLAYHDYVTGLYNRRFFEEEFERRRESGEFPIAILLGDINSFKVYNDTFGHIEGDNALRNTGEKIKRIIGQGDILARVGGDEFAIIVSGINEHEIKQYFDRVERESDIFSQDSLGDRLITISWGYGVQREKGDTLDMLQQEAEAYMYNRKFYNHKSMRSKTVDVIMETLFAKSEREKEHSERVGSLSEAIAGKMERRQSELDKIRVAGLLHDIGKIGIDEAILNKEEKLDSKEWDLIKLHPAKGAGILYNTKEYQDIADIVLSHHERFDGSGYPNKLKGEYIPLGSRIIAVADTFDAITNERPYKSPMSMEAAIKEMRRSAGTQLDPEIVAVFIKDVLGVKD